MRPITIPIRSLMPEPTDAVDYMAMPREMTTFEMPRCPIRAPTATWPVRATCCSASSGTGRWLAAADGGALPCAGPGRPAGRATLRVLNETLGEGEVSRPSSTPARGARAGDGVLRRLAPAAPAGRPACCTTTCWQPPSRPWWGAGQRAASSRACASAAAAGRDERAGAGQRTAGGDGPQRPGHALARHQPDAAAAVARRQRAHRRRARRAAPWWCCRAASATAASAARQRATSGACSTSTTCRR
jgi:hypothetical protein